MKYSDLPNIPRVPFIQVETCEDEDDDSWPLIDDGYSPPGLTRQGSQSCGELTWIEDASNNMTVEEPSPYVRVSPQGNTIHPSTSRSRAITRDGEYVYLRPATRKTKCTSLDKDPEDDDYSENIPAQGIIALRKYAKDRRSGVPSRVYEVLHNFNGNGVDELKLTAGDTVTCIMDKTGENGWFYGETQDGKKGLFPETFVKLLGEGPRQIRQSQVTFGFHDIESCLLGRGGCADVYKVTYNGKMAALKVFRKTQARPDPLAAVRQEAILINRLKHPNIIELFGMCLDVPNSGLLLELCEGKSLKNMLTHVEQTDTFVSVRFMVDWAVQIATAMEFLMRNNILHRDLKAENVLVKEPLCHCDRNMDEHARIEICPTDGCRGHTIRSKLTMKITDFGTTKEREDVTEEEKRKSANIVGTYSWMAPEAFRLHQYTEASDVWSFGVVLWEILTRKVPYEGVGPIIAAFNVSKNGSTLEVFGDCPMRWKSIMKSCWDIDPKLRPTFTLIKTDLSQYKTLLEADGVSVEEEERVQRTQQEIMGIITNFRDNPHATNEYNTYYEKLYKKISSVNDLIGIKNNPTTDQKVPPRPKRNKINKKDIGAPQDTRHLTSIRPTSTSPHGGQHNLTIILPSDSGTSSGADYHGTLPRIPRKPVEKEAHPSLSNVLSVSSPNLNQIVTDGNGTLKRKDAIKRKNKNSVKETNAIESLPEKFAEVSVADPSPKFVEALTTPVRKPNVPSGKLDAKRGSEETVKNKSTLQRLFGKFSNRNSRSIEDNGDDSTSTTSLPHSARSSTSSNKGLASFHHMTKGPTSLGSLDRPSAQSRQRVSSSNFTSDEENFSTLGRMTKNKISPSDDAKLSYGLTKPTSFAMVENLTYGGRGTARSFGLDETIPSPSDISSIMDYQQHRTHHRTPSDDYRIMPMPEFPKSAPTMSPPSHSAPKLHDHLDLSTVIPAVDEDPYVQCGIAPPFAGTHSAVNNSPYIQMPSKNPIFHGVTNDQYFHCSTRPERPDTLPLRHAATPESSGISTGGSSAFSSLSILNEQAPTMQAPPPPVLPRPPAIPPREGSVGLPVQSAS